MRAKTWNYPTCLSPDKWINNNGITSSTKNSVLSFVAKWLKMEDVSLMKLAKPREASAVCSFPFVETRRSRLEVRKMVTGYEWINVISAESLDILNCELNSSQH